MAQILIFGDSITDGSTDAMGGWADRLKQYFWQQNIKNGFDSEYHWVYNLGISGNQTADVLKRIEVESIARKVNNKNRRVVFVFAIGINDSYLVGKQDPKPSVSNVEFKNNYQKLINFAKQYTENVLCLEITPVDETKTSPIYAEYWYKNDRIKEFNKIIRELASKNSATLVQLFDEYINRPHFLQMLDDGLHPNDEGHEWMLNKVKPTLEEILNK